MPTRHLRLTFPENQVTEPVIYHLATDHHVVPNIRRANIENHFGWMVVELTGPAGSLVLLSCRVIHGSAGNRSPRMRPLLLNVYSSADSFPYVTNPIPSEYEGAIVAANRGLDRPDRSNRLGGPGRGDRRAHGARAGSLRACGCRDW